MVKSIIVNQGVFCFDYRRRVWMYSISPWRTDGHTKALNPNGMWMQEPPFLCWAKSSKLCISVCKSDCSCRRTLFKQKWSLDQSPRMPSSSNCAAVDISAPCKISLWCKPNPAVALNLQTAGAHHLNLRRPHFITWCRGGAAGARTVGEYMNYWWQFKK